MRVCFVLGEAPDRDAEPALMISAIARFGNILFGYAAGRSPLINRWSNKPGWPMAKRVTRVQASSAALARFARSDSVL